MLFWFCYMIRYLFSILFVLRNYLFFVFSLRRYFALSVLCYSVGFIVYLNAFDLIEIIIVWYSVVLPLLFVYVMRSVYCSCISTWSQQRSTYLDLHCRSRLNINFQCKTHGLYIMDWIHFIIDKVNTLTLGMSFYAVITQKQLRCIHRMNRNLSSSSTHILKTWRQHFLRDLWSSP